MHNYISIFFVKYPGIKKAFLFLFLLSSFDIYAQKLSPEEKRIIAEINKQMPETLQLLEQLVNINSGTLNIAGVKKCWFDSQKRI